MKNEKELQKRDIQVNTKGYAKKATYCATTVNWAVQKIITKNILPIYLVFSKHEVR